MAKNWLKISAANISSIYYSSFESHTKPVRLVWTCEWVLPAFWVVKVPLVAHYHWRTSTTFHIHSASLVCLSFIGFQFSWLPFYRYLMVHRRQERRFVGSTKCHLSSKYTTFLSRNSISIYWYMHFTFSYDLYKTLQTTKHIHLHL